MTTGVFAFGALLLFLLLMWLPFRLGFTVCPVKRLTGLKCPGCGFSGACRALLRLDFAGAMRCNPFMPAIAGYVAAVSVSSAGSYIKTGKRASSPFPEWLNITFLVLLVIWTVVRNIIGIYQKPDIGFFTRCPVSDDTETGSEPMKHHSSESTSSSFFSASSTFSPAFSASES